MRRHGPRRRFSQPSAFAVFRLLVVLLLALPAMGEDAPVAASDAGSDTLRISRQEAISYAIARNPGIAASREQVEQARAQTVIDSALPDPTVTASSVDQTHPTNVSSRNETDLGFGLTVPFPGKTRMRRDVATANLRSAELSLTQLRQQVASQVAQAYDALLVALRHRDDLRQSKEYATNFLQKTQARFAAGSVAKVDVLKAQLDTSQAENDLIANEGTILAARASLNRLLGRLGGAQVEATDTLDIPASVPSVESLEQLAESSRPELQSAGAQREGARTATRLARQYWAPDLNLALTRNSVNGQEKTFTTDLTIGVPLFFWQHRNGEVAASVHRELELDASLIDIRAQVSLDVRSAFATASTALRQAVFIRDQLLPEASEVYRVASVSYGLGGSSALELLDAKRALLDAARQYADALGAANDARAALELAVGAPLTEAKSGDVK